MRKVSPLILENYINPKLPIIRVTEKNHKVVSESTKIGSVIDQILGHAFDRNFRSYFVVDSNKKMKGMLTSTDILSFLGAGPKYKLFPEKKLETHVSRVMERNPKYMKKHTILEKALPVFRRAWYGTYPILQDDEFRGAITQWDIIKHVKGKTNLHVSDIMVRKLHVTREEYSLFDTTKMMIRGAFNTLPVTHKGILTGFITPYEVLRFLDKTNNLTNLREIDAGTDQVMKRSMFSVKPTDDISDVIFTMKRTKLSSLPVVHYDEVVGIINEKDII
ncbi:MAG: CBS domain-containing protein, partial [Nanoarchaeota archaeon]|nr:CBS domain-containing protein [Nanoarchaeota archaeon]